MQVNLSLCFTAPYPTKKSFIKVSTKMYGGAARELGRYKLDIVGVKEVKVRQREHSKSRGL